MLPLLTWLALSGALAAPPDTPGIPEPAPTEQPGSDNGPADICDTPPPDRSAPFRAEFERARETYLLGCHQESEVLFLALSERIDAGEDPGASLSVEALLFLSEVRLNLGDRSSAMETLKRIARTWPDTPVNELDHDPDVLAYFEAARLAVRTEPGNDPDPPPPKPPPPPPPLPAWGYLPLGIPQARQGRTAGALLLGAGQVGAGAVSIWGFLRMAGTYTGPAPVDQLPRANELRAIQWAGTTAFYALWLTSHLEGRRAWRKDHRARFAVTALPQPEGGASIAVHARF